MSFSTASSRTPNKQSQRTAISNRRRTRKRVMFIMRLPRAAQRSVPRLNCGVKRIKATCR